MMCISFIIDYTVADKKKVPVSSRFPFHFICFILACRCFAKTQNESRQRGYNYKGGLRNRNGSSYMVVEYYYGYCQAGSKHTL